MPLCTVSRESKVARYAPGDFADAKLKRRPLNGWRRRGL